MISLRSFAPIAFTSLALSATSSCKDDPAPKPEPVASAQSSAGLDKGNKLGVRDPHATRMAIDPQTLKEYRVDVCYYSTLSFRQARDAYLASVGTDGPSAKKLPNFGIPNPPTPAASAAAKPSPAASGAAKAPPAPAAPKAHGSAGAPAPSGQAAKDMRRPFDMATRAPYERNARACSVAQGLKDPAMPEVDAAIAAFAPYALELSKNISEAAAYYQREGYKEDKFEKGKQYHQKLVEAFGKLDELSDKLGTAVAAWRKDHPPDASKMDEGQKLAFAAFDEANKLLVALLPKKVDVGAYKEGVPRLEKAIEALKTFGTANAADAWSKGMVPSLDMFLKMAKEAEPKVAETGLAGEMFGQMISSFVALIENKQRAVSRALFNKNQGAPARAPIARPGAPSATPEKAPAPTQ